MAEHYLAIVGLGGMGNWHRELVCGEGNWNNRECEAIERLHLAGSFDIRQERQDFARSVGLPTYDSLEQLLNDSRVDIVLCSVTNNAHIEIVKKALLANKNVVCEKPAALSSEQFSEMVQTAKSVNKALMIHQNRRWDEDFLAVKNLYDNNLLGDKPFKIESRVQGSRGIPGDWRQLPECGGGMVFDWGVHLFDQALMMIPEKVKKVYASFTHVTNKLVDDGFTAELTFESGLVFVVEVGTSNYVALPRWYVLGKDGTAVIDDWRSQGKIVRITDYNNKDAIPVRTAAGLTKTMAPRTNNTIEEIPLPAIKADIRDFYRNMMDVIENKSQPIVKAEQVMRVMKLMEAVFESAQKHQTVDFE